MNWGGGHTLSGKPGNCWKNPEIRVSPRKFSSMHIHLCCFEKNANESWNFKGNALETQAV
jgi:hypothetical protein